MKIKYCEIYYDNDESYINDEGVLEFEKFDGYELFCKLYMMMEGEGSECGVSKEEFEESWLVSKMRDWIMIKGENDIIIFNKV
jgi:hypothetical protein